MIFCKLRGSAPPSHSLRAGTSTQIPCLNPWLVYVIQGGSSTGRLHLSGKHIFLASLKNNNAVS